MSVSRRLRQFDDELVAWTEHSPEPSAAHSELSATVRTSSNWIDRWASNPRWTAGPGRWLSQLDRVVLDRTYGTVWLVAGSVTGGLVAGLGLCGALAGGGGGATAEPFAFGSALFVLPLYEVWRRRRQALGRPAPFSRLTRLDDRVIRRVRGR